MHLVHTLPVPLQIEQGVADRVLVPPNSDVLFPEKDVDDLRDQDIAS